MSKDLYIVYEAYEVKDLNLDYYVLTDWTTVRYSLDGSQCIVRIRPGYEEFFNLSRAITHAEAVALMATTAWRTAATKGSEPAPQNAVFVDKLALAEPELYNK